MPQSSIPAPAPADHRPSWPIRFSVERTDRHRVPTVFAVVGLTAGALLAWYGLPPVDLHGPLYQLGIMCPFCGATRSVRLAMMGEWAASFQHNPLGIPLVLGASFLVVRYAVGAVTRRWLNAAVRFNRIMLAVAMLAIIALWVNQQLHVELIGP